MKIYLDTCSLQRPLDDRRQLRISLEAEAVLGIIKLIEEKKIELVSSEPLLYEISNIPNRIRKNYGLYILNKAVNFIKVNYKVEKLAGKFIEYGIDPLDTLHLAAAEASFSDYFCTTDDKLLRKTKAIKNLHTRALDPIEFIKEIDK